MILFPRILSLLIISASFSLAQTAEEWFAFAEKLEAKGDSSKALAAYLEADKKKPNDSQILVKLGKQWSDYMTELKDEGQRKDAAKKSLFYSRKALKVAPNASDSHLAVALSLGKNIEYMGNKEKIRASKEVKARAQKALSLNPKSDYAHHLLGRWHQNVASMGGVTRALAKVIYGEIPKGSYQDALGHFEKARQLRPDRLIHQIEYGRTLVMMGQKAKGVVEIKKGLAMPNKEKDDAESKVRGRSSL